MADLEQLWSLIDAATGPSRDLDAMVFAALDNPTNFVCPDERPGSPRLAAHIKAYTASLDVALDLIERSRKALGCYAWRVELDDEPVYHPFYAHLSVSKSSPVYGKGDGASGTFTEDGGTPALAALSVLLAAMIALEKAR